MPALMCAVLKLRRSQLLLYISVVLHTQTQHQGHTHYKQITFIAPRTLSASSVIDVPGPGVYVTSGFVLRASLRSH